MQESLQTTLDKVNEHLDYAYTEPIKKLLIEVR